MNINSKSSFVTGGLALLLSAAPSAVFAQAIERHAPLTPPVTTAPLALSNALPNEQDATPIGPALRSVVLLGQTEEPHAGAPDGVTIGNIPRLSGDAPRASITRLLTPYLGRAISRQLIAQLEAAIAQYYRDTHFPFVSLSTPEQEISSGAIQLRVIEFKLGDVSLRGAMGEEADNLRSRITVEAGEAINSRTLQNDLDWINRYPYRQVQAVFVPGDTLGTTNLTLTAVPIKPWQVYGGYANDGSPSTGRDRLFLGGSVGDILGDDSVLSVQATLSPDVLEGKTDPHYQSGALNYSIPVGLHSDIEASADITRTFLPSTPFVINLTAAEGDVGYRFALPDIIKDYPPMDARVGVEVKRETKKILFGGVDAFDVSMNVYQLYAGLHGSGESPLLSHDWDLVGYFSPGGLGASNSSAQAALFSQGHVRDASYGYIKLNYRQSLNLPFNLSLKSNLFGQFAPTALPSTEQYGVGGAYLVRGYSLDDGSFDSVIILRNELHAELFDQTPSFGVDPYLFSDIGHGHDDFAHTGTDVASIGVGAAVNFLQHSVLKLDIANQLLSNRAVHAGGWLFNINIVASY